MSITAANSKMLRNKPNELQCAWKNNRSNNTKVGRYGIMKFSILRKIKHVWVNNTR